MSCECLLIWIIVINVRSIVLFSNHLLYIIFFFVYLAIQCCNFLHSAFMATFMEWCYDHVSFVSRFYEPAAPLAFYFMYLVRGVNSKAISLYKMEVFFVCDGHIICTTTAPLMLAGRYLSVDCSICCNYMT